MPKKPQKSNLKNNVVSPRSGVPHDLEGRHLPKMPLIDGEDEPQFQSFQTKCYAAVQPKDAIEEVWLQDFINYTWEADRLRRMKAALIQSARRQAVEDILFEYGDEEIGDRRNYSQRKTVSEGLSEHWSRGEKEFVDFVDALLAEHDLNIDTIMAKAVASKIEDLERIDKLIASYDTRRDAALRELEKRRDLIAKRLKEIAATDADYVEVEAAE